MTVYAVVSVADKQFMVHEGDVIDVPRLEDKEGSTLSIAQVLFIGGEKGVKVGQPYVDGATVGAKVELHVKGPKVVSFKFRRRKGSKRTIGHRQPLTRIRIDKISG